MKTTHAHTSNDTLPTTRREPATSRIRTGVRAGVTGDFSGPAGVTGDFSGPRRR